MRIPFVASSLVWLRPVNFRLYERLIALRWLSTMWYQFLFFVLVTVLWPIRMSSCQKELGDVEHGCPQGSYRMADYCYVIFETFVSYEEAEKICETGSGILAPIKDEETQQFMQKLRIRKYLHRYWFGLSDQKTEGKWVFTDGTRLAGFSNWQQGEPNNFNKIQHCVNIAPAHQFKWDDDDCARKLLYVCQFDRAGDNCTDTQTQFNSSCYKLSQDVATFGEAEQDCQLGGGHLAAIKSEKTFTFLKSLIYADKFWKNMTDEHMQAIFRNRGSKLSWVPQTWIGTRYLEGAWVHSDGSAVNLTWWAPGEPHTNSNGEDCVKLGLLWSDTKCDSSHGFICRYDATAESKEPATSDSCNQDNPESGKISSAAKSSPSYSGSITIEVTQFSMVLLVCAMLGALFAGLIFTIINLRRRWFNSEHRRNSSHDMEILREPDEELA